MLRAICYADATGWTEVEDVSRISNLLADGGNLVWAEAEVSHLTQSDVATIAEEFGLHPLAVEDALNPRQRPKLEAYEKHLFGVMHQLEMVDGQLEASQIACFIGTRFVLTIHAGAGRTLQEARERCRRAPKPRERGPSFIMHALLDTIVDDYQRTADDLEDEVEDLEETVLRDPQAPVGKQLYTVKQRLARLRRYALPGERVLSSLVGPAGAGPVPQETSAYFRDVLDHVLRITDQIRHVEELVDALLQLRSMEQQKSLNEVTKRLTGWAAVIAVPTLIASVYGMNFSLLPSTGQRFGFWFAIVLMGSSALGLYLFFRRRRWI